MYLVELPADPVHNLASLLPARGSVVMNLGVAINETVLILYILFDAHFLVLRSLFYCFFNDEMKV